MDTVGSGLRACRVCVGGTSQRSAMTPRSMRKPSSVEQTAELPISYPIRWKPGHVIREIAVTKPLLASWDASHLPSQQRLQSYLAGLADEADLDSLPPDGLFLELVVGVERSEHLERGHDLENYLTPLAAHFGPNRFVHARAVKCLHTGSMLRIGAAIIADELDSSWQRLAVDAGTGTSQKRWKEGIRDALLASGERTLPPGPIAVDLAWRCGAHRNWVNLWKPTGDAMGPLLGEPQPSNPFNPADDRIVELTLHRELTENLGHYVHVGIGWQSR